MYITLSSRAFFSATSTDTCLAQPQALAPVDRGALASVGIAIGITGGVPTGGSGGGGGWRGRRIRGEVVDGRKVTLGDISRNKVEEGKTKQIEGEIIIKLKCK